MSALAADSTASICLDPIFCTAVRQIYDQWIQQAESFQDTQDPASDENGNPDLHEQELRCLTEAGHVCTDSCTRTMTRAKVEAILSGVFCYSCGGEALHNLIVKWWFDVHANNKQSLSGEWKCLCLLYTGVYLNKSSLPSSC